MGGPLSSVTTWSCQSLRRTHDRMTKRGGLNARGYLCMDIDMPKCYFKGFYLRGTLMGKKCWEKCFYSVVLAGGPNCVSLIIISQHEDSFCSKISQGAASFSFWIELIESDWLEEKFDLKVKFSKEQEYSISLLFMWGSPVSVIHTHIQNTPTQKRHTHTHCTCS